MRLLLIPICFTIAFLISSYQIYRCLKYLRNSIRLSHSYSDKIEQGCMRDWEYLFLFIPIRYRDYYSQPGIQGGNFYLTPLVGVLALYGNPLFLIAALFCGILSTGGRLFKILSICMLRLPFYWGYFACLAIIIASVGGLRTLHLSTQKMAILCVLEGILLLFNSENLPLYPESMWTKSLDKWFNTPLLIWLEKNSKWYRVNNMQYPYYHGQVNHIKSMGYCGGNHTKDIHKKRGIPNVGCGGYDWFNFKEDGKELDNYQVAFHIGYEPKDKKWVQSKEFKKLWINTNLYSFSTETIAQVVK